MIPGAVCPENQAPVPEKRKITRQDAEPDQQTLGL